MSLSEKIKPRVQIINISMIDVYLVWFIYIYYFYFAKKSLSKNKLQTIPHLESGFDVVHCASEIKPDCSVMSAIVFQNMLVRWLFSNHTHHQTPDCSCMHFQSRRQLGMKMQEAKFATMIHRVSLRPAFACFKARSPN